MNDNENNNKIKLKDILVLKEFEDIFPEEVPGLPLKIDIEFMINMIPRAAPTLKFLSFINLIR